MSDEKGCCPFDSRLPIKIFSRMSILTIVISTGMVLCITGQREGGKELRSFQRDVSFAKIDVF